MWHPNDVVRRVRIGRDDPTIDRNTAEQLLDGTLRLPGSTAR